jgi:hypothetical protein
MSQDKENMAQPNEQRWGKNEMTNERFVISANYHAPGNPAIQVLKRTGWEGGFEVFSVWEDVPQGHDPFGRAAKLASNYAAAAGARCPVWMQLKAKAELELAEKRKELETMQAIPLSILSLDSVAQVKEAIANLRGFITGVECAIGEAAHD